MEQIQPALQFVKEHRFWFSTGLAALLATFVLLSTGDLTRKVVSERNRLKGGLDAISKYTAGSNPNPKWKEKAEEKRDAVKEDYEAVWTKLYLEQEPLMTFPAELQPIWFPLEPGKSAFRRSFGEKLEDNQNEYLYKYRDLAANEAADVYFKLDALEEEKGKLYGTIDVPAREAIISAAQFGRDPNSLEVWLNQEQLWIQREVIAALVRVNADAEKANKEAFPRWKAAPIKRLLRLGIGEAAISGMAGPKVTELKPYIAEDANAPQQPGRGGAGSQQGTVIGLNEKRYSEKNERFRIVPVSLSMLVDQRRIPDVLVELGNVKFNFTIRETQIDLERPRIDMPEPLKGEAIGGKAEDNPLYNTVRLDVYATARLFEIPPVLKEKREKARKGEAPAEDPSKAAAPSDGKEPAKETPKEPVKADAKKEAEKPKEPAKETPKEPAKADAKKEAEKPKEPAKEAPKEPAKADAKKEAEKPKEPAKEPAKADAKKEAEKPKEPAKADGKKA